MKKNAILLLILMLCFLCACGKEEEEPEESESNSGAITQIISSIRFRADGAMFDEESEPNGEVEEYSLCWFSENGYLLTYTDSKGNPIEVHFQDADVKSMLEQVESFNKGKCKSDHVGDEKMAALKKSVVRIQYHLYENGEFLQPDDNREIYDEQDADGFYTLSEKDFAELVSQFEDLRKRAERLRSMIEVMLPE